MLTNFKALIVIAIIAATIFIIAKPICLRFMDTGDFARRRNTWFALTLTAFISPTYWLFVLVAIVLLVWSARKDANPVAFYVLVLHVIHPVAMAIPAIGTTQLFDVNNYRILAFAILIPAALRLMRSTDKTVFKLTSMDALIFFFCGLQLALYVPYEALTNTMRRGFLVSIDVLLLYFVVSRTCTSRRVIVETLASFCLACAIYAPLALFESIKGWLLYEGLGLGWGNAIPFNYMLRADTLRATVSAGHSIPLGYMMAIAFGFWLYLSSRVQSMTLTVIIAIWMWVGLLAAYSRAPWIVAVAIFFAFLGLGPNGATRFFKASLISALLAGLILVSPIGERVIDNLPFVGTVDAGSISYRKRLAEVSWQLIQKNPFFGNPFFLQRLEEMRQGQGIIDLINAYASIAMAYGLVGLCLILGFFFVGMWNAHRLYRTSFGSDPDLSLLGANLIACMFGTLLMLAMGGLGTSVEKMFYILAGLAAGYGRLGQSTGSAQASLHSNRARYVV